MKKVVKEFIDNIMVLTPEEREYIDRFIQGEYIPGLLFKEEKIVERIKNHLMALWKTNNIRAGK